MPFVAYLKEQAQRKGLSALNTTLDFNEYEVLKTNEKYLEHTLQVKELAIRYSDEVDSTELASNAAAYEEIAPGKPIITFKIDA